MSASVHLEICVLGLCFLHVLALNPPQVSLKQGVARGFYDTTVNGRPFAAFLGIPYARPPIRKHRFKEALPAEPWTGVYNAAFEPPMCLQYDHVTYKTDFPVHGNEDCLYINVFTPQVPNGNMTHYDVIVFIHGGAFMFSSGFVYGPQKLLDKDIVFVTFNYRLGPLGFLSTEDDIVPGNMGLKDQTLALKWVKKNIAAFGGNPDSVTITGMSAGGSSVHYHMLSPLSKGLFNRVISVSGTALCPWAQTENAKEKAHMIASSLGCPVDNSTILVECLRNRPAKQILEATRMFMPWLYNPFSPFGPVVEKAGKRPFIDRSPIEIIKTGVISDVPLLMSFTLDEGLYPAAEIICTGDSLNELNKEWIKLAPYVLDYIHTVPPDQLNNVSKNIWIRYVGEKEEANLQEIIQVILFLRFMHN
ncbi:hypothetical protein AAG570_000437 [Ranatra chinensis]|uniref:Carboxylic ester hydrolase n=1 Tax=Ranatra chinensis TaxID=642074 RepID=A0ABD0YX45_9HEMI